MEVRSITAADTRPLRQAVLRPHQTIDELVFPGEEDPVAGHLGVFDDEELIGVVSIFPEPREAGDDGGWRIRGMATAPAWRRRGVGAALLTAALAHVVAAGGTSVWCSARTPAVGFYERFGFGTVGDEYDVPDIGPHYLMERSI